MADGPSATAGPLPPPSGPQPPPPGLTAFSEIDDELRRLVPASIAFNAPTTMRLDHTAHIQLLLSPAASIPELKKKITAIGEREGTTIKVSPLMEARLSGLHFTIEANTPERQPVSNVAPTEWSWDVEPTETGNQELHLTLTAILSVGGHNQPEDDFFSHVRQGAQGARHLVRPDLGLRVRQLEVAVDRDLRASGCVGGSSVPEP